MTDPSPHQPATGGPKKQPYGPGILMVLGLFMLVIAAWCGYDLATKEEWQEEGKTGAIVFNWAGMIGFGLAAVYAFVLAAMRSKAAAAGAPPTASQEPEPPGAPPEAPTAEAEGGAEAGPSLPLRCSNCGLRQYPGDRAKYLARECTPDTCMRCGSDLVPCTDLIPQETLWFVAQLIEASAEWEKAHSLGLAEAARGITTHYHSTETKKKEMEERYKKLVAEIASKRLLEQVLVLLVHDGSRPALYLWRHYAL